MQLTLYIIPILYFSYLLDPFTEKVQKRNYKRLIGNGSYLKVHLLCSLLIAAICLTIAYFNRTYFDSCIFCLAPFLFIILVKIVNRYSAKKYNRDFNLILRGDSFKYAFFDMVFSFLVLILPLGLSFLLIVQLGLRLP